MIYTPFQNQNLQGVEWASRLKQIYNRIISLTVSTEFYKQSS